MILVGVLAGPAVLDLIDGSILGMTSFTEMGVQVFEDDDNEAFFFLDGKTVLVEKDLNYDSKLKGRKNFTLMHEGSHQIFKMLFPNDYGITQKSAGVHYYKANSERNKPISDWEEWQANTLGAAILLPENLIKQGMYLFSLGEKIECLNKIYFPGVYKRFDALADFLGCSKILLIWYLFTRRGASREIVGTKDNRKVQKLWLAYFRQGNNDHRRD